MAQGGEAQGRVAEYMTPTGKDFDKMKLLTREGTRTFYIGHKVRGKKPDVDDFVKVSYRESEYVDAQGNNQVSRWVIDFMTPPHDAPLPAKPQTDAHNYTDNTAVQIFVTGFLGRCFQGTGSIPDAATLTDMVRNVRIAFADGMKDEPVQAPTTRRVGDEPPDEPDDPWAGQPL